MVAASPLHAHIKGAPAAAVCLLAGHTACRMRMLDGPTLLHISAHRACTCRRPFADFLDSAQANSSFSPCDKTELKTTIIGCVRVRRLRRARAAVRAAWRVRLTCSPGAAACTRAAPAGLGGNSLWLLPWPAHPAGGQLTWGPSLLS